MKIRPLLFAAFALAAVLGLFFLWRPAAPPASAATAAAPAAPQAQMPADAPAPVAGTFEFVVRRGERSAGPVAMQVRAGDDVVIKVNSDQAGELHVHGYDLQAPVTPAQPAALYFKATHTGRFEVELHGLDLPLGTLEVLPK